MPASSMNMNMSGDVEKDFANMMIQHHQGGVKMAREYLKSCKNQKMVKMAIKKLRRKHRTLKC